MASLGQAVMADVGLSHMRSPTWFNRHPQLCPHRGCLCPRGDGQWVPSTGGNLSCSSACITPCRSRSALSWAHTQTLHRQPLATGQAGTGPSVPQDRQGTPRVAGKPALAAGSIWSPDGRGRRRSVLGPGGSPPPFMQPHPTSAVAGGTPKPHCARAVHPAPAGRQADPWAGGRLMSRPVTPFPAVCPGGAEGVPPCGAQHVLASPLWCRVGCGCPAVGLGTREHRCWPQDGDGDTG